MTVEISAVEDAGVLENFPAFNGGGSPYFVLDSHTDPNLGDIFDHNFVLFNLSALPAGAVIDSAVFRLHVNASADPLDIEYGARQRHVGGKHADLEQPACRDLGRRRFHPWHPTPQQGDVDWPVKPLLEAWLAGTQPNDGLVLRGVTAGTGERRTADTRRRRRPAPGRHLHHPGGRCTPPPTWATHPTPPRRRRNAGLCGRARQLPDRVGWHAGR